MVERFPDKKEVHSSILCTPTDMTQFPEGCVCRKFKNLIDIEHDLGGGWSAYIQYIYDWGEISEDIHPDHPCYVAWAIEQAKEFNEKSPWQRYSFNGNCKRCSAAMNLFIYPPPKVEE